METMPDSFQFYTLDDERSATLGALPGQTVLLVSQRITTEGPPRIDGVPVMVVRTETDEGELFTTHVVEEESGTLGDAFGGGFRGIFGDEGRALRQQIANHLGQV